MIPGVIETTSPDVKHPDVHVLLGYLRGQEGNAFTILGRVEKALKAAGYDADSYAEEAMAGDYEHLLAVTSRWVRTFEQIVEGEPPLGTPTTAPAQATT